MLVALPGVEWERASGGLDPALLRALTGSMLRPLLCTPPVDPLVEAAAAAAAGAAQGEAGADACAPGTPRAAGGEGGAGTPAGGGRSCGKGRPPASFPAELLAPLLQFVHGSKSGMDQVCVGV